LRIQWFNWRPRLSEAVPEANVAGEVSHNSGVAGRYATALFELAMEGRAVEGVARDMAALKALLAASPDLARLVSAPVFSTEEQRVGMDAILRRMEAAPLTVRFVLTLANKRRLSALLNIIRAFEKLLRRQKGEVDAEVVAARLLSESESVELRRMLKAKLGREARLTSRVDPGLLGGLVIKVGSRMIDSSLRTKLEGLRSAMRGH
jgi:F-type H+-transporting ATPase subunit delta